MLGGCDKIIEAAMSAGGGAGSSRKGGAAGSLATQVRIEGAAKPEIGTAFQEISNAASAHNLVLVQRYEAGRPGNGAAYSEGIRTLDKAGHRHGGLTKRIIDAVSVTWIREKGIFVVFDSMQDQMEGMRTRGGTAANQRRAYVQIINSGIRTYDNAIRYLESGEEAQLRYNFKKKGVPIEVVEEFFRLRSINGEKIMKIEKEMFSEGRAALQSYRSAFSQTDQSKASAHIAEGNRHQQKSDQLMAQMIAEIRKYLSQSIIL